MTIKMRAKNFDLFDGAKKGVETELNKLSGMFQEGTVFDVLFTKRDKDFKCKITVQNGRDFVRSEELGKTVEFALNNAVNTLKKRVRKVKSMKITKKRGNAALSETIDDKDYSISMSEEELIDFDIEKRKSIKLDIMTEEEAILYLESLNHAFYVFKNREKSGRVCIVYKRNVGYGILETN